MDIIEEGFKRCSKCGKVKPLSLFYKKKSSKDGLMSYCKECAKAMDTQYRKAHKEKKKAYNAEYYQDNKEAILKQKAEYYQDNKEAIAQKKSEWYTTHKDKIKAYNAEYYQSNKEKIKAYNAEYHAEYHNPQKNPLGWAKMTVNAYRKMDRDRGFDDSKTITAEWFLENIAYRKCVHCGKQGIGKVGCNRLDNTKGHTQDNVESCCFKCNCKDNIRDQLERGIHMSCKHKKQSFKTFVNAHKAKDKNSQ